MEIAEELIIAKVATTAFEIMFTRVLLMEICMKKNVLKHDRKSIRRDVTAVVVVDLRVDRRQSPKLIL